MATARDLEADLDWLVGRIRDGYEPEKIILFGSLARGETHEYSDIDLIVVKVTGASYGERVNYCCPFCGAGSSVRISWSTRPRNTSAASGRVGAWFRMWSVTERSSMNAADDPRSWQRLADADMAAARALATDERSEKLLV